MDPPATPPSRVRRFPIFILACWAIGLVTLVQLLIAAAALAARFEKSRESRVVVKEVVKPLVLRVPVPATEPDAGVISRPSVSQPARVTTASSAPAPAPAPSPPVVPQIADARCERLLREARAARVAGDMGLAVMKLEEVMTSIPDDPNVVYEMGVVHEQMGIFDRAGDHYQKVMQMGLPRAGQLYHLAAAKLRDGFEQPGDLLGKLSLGRIRLFKQGNPPGGQRTILTIPVQKSPTEEIDLEQLTISVRFFNRRASGEVIELEDKSWVSQQWMSEPFDWAGGEEFLRMIYTIPPSAQSGDVFESNDITYHGQVVSLLYKGEVLDMQAWPRDLAARTTGIGSSHDQSPEFLDALPAGFDPDLPLLPPLTE
jgi:hypothetical protein